MNLFEAAKKVSILDVARSLARINPEKVGTNWQALCPFHEDTNPSLFFDDEKNIFKCFGCNASGSNIDLVITAGLARESKEAAELIVRYFGIPAQEQNTSRRKPPGDRRSETAGISKTTQSGESKKAPPTMHSIESESPSENEDRPFTLKDYSELKKLPIEFLKSLGIWDDGDKVCIPYYGKNHEAGKEVAKSASPITTSTEARRSPQVQQPNGPTALVRYRRWNSFWWPPKSKLIMYGLDRLDLFPSNNPSNDPSFIIQVEGESDTQTLWLHGYPALGIPGARNFKEDWTEYIKPFKKVYLHREPDEAGQIFVKRITRLLTNAGYEGEILVFSIDGYKDPNELHKTYADSPDKFRTVFEAALNTAVPPAPEDIAGSKDKQEIYLTADQIIEAVRENPADVFTQPVLDSLARLSTPELAQVKMALKGKVSMADLNQAVREEKRRLRIHIRAAGPGERSEAPSLQEVLDDCPADMPIPAGWQISEEGVFEFVTRQGETGPSQAVERRFPIPVVLTCVQKPLDPADEGTSYELAFNSDGNWNKTAFPATTLFDKVKLTSTAAAGLPVDSENARGLLRWLAALRDLKMLPLKQVVTRCGWHKKIFVLGSRVVKKDIPIGVSDVPDGGIKADGVSGADDTGTDSRVDWTSSIKSSEKELVNGFHTKGDAEKQKRLIIETVKKYPLAGFLIGASCAGPLMRLFHAEGRLEIHGFIVEVVSDQAGIGKTTGQELAASIWGNPGRLVRTFDRTTVAWEVLLHTLCDMPVFLEETQMTSREDTALKLVYALALGMGRERGNRSGGMRATRQFFNTVLLSSERSLKTFAAREGIEARVITLPPVFGGRSPERGEELRRLRAEYFSHYGHAGHAYISYLVDQLAGGKWDRILDYYEKFYGLLDKALPLGIDGETKSIAMRMATRVAACWTGLQLLLESLGMEWRAALDVSLAAMMRAWEKITAELDTVPLWKKALAVIQSYAAENVHRIAGMELVDVSGRERLPSGGYIGGLVNIGERKAVGFFPNAFNETVKKYLGIEGETVRKGLVREGVVIPDKAGKSARNQRVHPAGGDSYVARVICIPVECVFPDEEFKRERTEKEFSWDDI